MLEILRSFRMQLVVSDWEVLKRLINRKALIERSKVNFEAFRANVVMYKDAFENKMNVLIK